MGEDQGGTLTIESHGEEETREIGRLLGQSLAAGIVVGLVGDLGAGKTRLAQAICDGLEVDISQVNSPTFVLIQEYEGRLPVYHFDTYRLRDTDEFLELGADDYMSSVGVCLIEWSDRVVDLLPRDRLTVEVEILGEASRGISIIASGKRSNSVLMSFAEKRC
jgi:tRNA threonylcarbamoyladenosine biosynthesis protein TsaE